MTLHAERQRVAVVLGAVLRKAIDDHYDQCERCPVWGIVWCPVGYQLWLLLPEGDRVPPIA